jgi:hypothetical protein
MAIKQTKPCDSNPCKGVAAFSNHCGTYVCGTCGSHVGLDRCYCGWSRFGGNGRTELIEMGEVIGEEGEIDL